jgi:hypothetical protein
MRPNSTKGRVRILSSVICLHAKDCSHSSARENRLLWPCPPVIGVLNSTGTLANHHEEIRFECELIACRTYPHVLHMIVSEYLLCRFKNVAWRLLGLFPNLKQCASSQERARLWHFCTAKIFENYDRFSHEGMLVLCNDGVVWDIVIVLSFWQGNQPETDVVNCSVQVRPPVCHVAWFDSRIPCADTQMYTGQLSHVQGPKGPA